MECEKKTNLKSCSCTYEPCPRKGVCCECVAYHRANGELPGCLFSPDAERTYDRSFANFTASLKKE
ncbi:MAG: DUF6485 family protein [Elusimicrobia bacterium]|nr:DUF6485 family protein [Elusimicrobiota bacterium]